MNFLYRTLGLALRALSRNYMRSALTALGIIIGVAAVIAMVEIVKGSTTAVENTIKRMGANNLLIYPGAATTGGVNQGSGTLNTLIPEDADVLQHDCYPAVFSAAPIVRARTQVVYGNHNWQPNIMNGTTPAYLTVREWEDLDEGACFTDQDVRNMAKVCLLGQTGVRELFGDESPIGKEVRLQNVTLKVIGVLSKKGANMWGTDQDDILIAPWTTIKFKVAGAPLANVNQSAKDPLASASQVNSTSQRYLNQPNDRYLTPPAVVQNNYPLRIGFTNVDQILIRASSAEEVPNAIVQIKDVLRERHRIHPGQGDDFIVRDMTESSKALSSTTTSMASLLLCVALISLIVGGVGIMNIMLVSVTERTREIGLRMAVGARARDILRQFLVEAVLLCLAGGAVGIIFGRLSSWMIHNWVGWPTEVSIPAVAMAFGVSALTGIIFGYYPAWKASRLDPIEALRYE
jgi:ABC-type antimicrobial peptide transport system permease subunit